MSATTDAVRIAKDHIAAWPQDVEVVRKARKGCSCGGVVYVERCDGDYWKRCANCGDVSPYFLRRSAAQRRIAALLEALNG